ncbi:BAR domain-containing family protein [Phakopsora pachyrhizi]|nr:BAR domain-containing family protein [Phakopsora pachyrhizi]
MSWKTIQNTLGSLGQNVQQGVAGLKISEQTDKFSKSFATLSQTAREKLGTLDQDDVTELPEEYKKLEQKVDSLRDAYSSLLRIARVYESEGYDYPTQINESLTETAATISHSLTSWASAATKGTNLPPIEPSARPRIEHKTLSHALSRAATSGALAIGSSGSPNPNLDNNNGGISTLVSKSLKSYALVQDKVGDDRLAQDKAIQNEFLKPWQLTLNQGIQAAMKSRQNVRSSRLALDAARLVMKNSAGGPKQEQARLEVENAEEKLVLATEEAIGLMKRVLDDPEPIKALAQLVKAQHAYHSSASNRLQGLIGEFEDAAVTAEAEFRKSRS